jgi:hypothetical protein
LLKHHDEESFAKKKWNGELKTQGLAALAPEAGGGLDDDEPLPMPPLPIPPLPLEPPGEAGASVPEGMGGGEAGVGDGMGAGAGVGSAGALPAPPSAPPLPASLQAASPRLANIAMHKAV